MEKDNRIDIEWGIAKGKRSLNFTFHNVFTEQVADITIFNWEKELKNNVSPGEKIDIVCNCIHLTKYDNAARKSWQRMLKENTDKINITWVVSENSFFKTGTQTMGLLSGFEVETVTSLQELETEQLKD